MTQNEKEMFAKTATKTIVSIGGILTCLWIIYYLYDLLWKK
jgi:hypothetical protein